MTSWAPSGVEAPDRLAASRPPAALWYGLWIAAAVAEALALRPVLLTADAPVNWLDVVFSLVGGSFAAFGLIAWRRRPESRSGICVRWWKASRPRRRALLPSLAGCIVLIGFATVLANDLVTGNRSQPLLWFTVCSLVTVPAAFLGGLLRSRLARGGLNALATRSSVATSVTFETAERLPEPVELAAYFVACEALTNASKYAGATCATVRVWRDGPLAGIEIADDGIAGADDSRGTGLRGLADRVEALDGRLHVTSPPGHGTTVVAELPCRS